jgi:alpha-glucoside transport system substrate-binding protein
VGNYSDPTQAKLGELLANATGLVPDIGDTIPSGFGSAEWTAIVNYVNGGDLAVELEQATQVQQEAVGAN